ncbi:MAG TPA: substrate-binding domain-containing protein [Clostridiaceae bacterium]|nr:substrate-binding domain-containing protein [Clostridiaceae bacterium]
MTIWTKHDAVNELFEPARSNQLDELINKSTAIFCHDDRIAYTLINYLKLKGLRVPEDISVVGYDDSYYATLNTPITTVSHPKAQYGTQAAKAIIDLINNPRQFDISNYVIEPQLIVRKSVAPIKNE